MQDFTHLHVHSKYSINDGMMAIATYNKDGDISSNCLVGRAKELGFSHIALTDHGKMGGIPSFAKACKGAGLHGIIGCEIYLCKDMLVKQAIEVQLPDGTFKKRRPWHNHMGLLCTSEEGYENLVEISNIAASEGFYYEPRVDWSIVEPRSKGLVALGGCLSGEIAKAILDNTEDEETAYKNAREIAARYRDTFGERFFLEVQYHDDQDIHTDSAQSLREAQRKVVIGVMKMSKDLGIPVVATNDVHYLNRSDKIAHDALKCLRKSDTANTGEGYPTGEFYLKSAERMYSRWTGHEEVCQNTMLVAEMCQWKFPTQVHWHYPNFEIVEDAKFSEWRKRQPKLTEKQAYLAYLCFKSMVGKKLNEDVEAQKRVKYELDIIYEMGVEEYFLMIWDIFRFCKEKRIKVGPGRGCLTGDALVLTEDRGYTRLDEIKIGDSVCTHTGEYENVSCVMQYPIKDEKLLEIKTEQSFNTIKLTSDHKVYAVCPTRAKKADRPYGKKCRQWEFENNPSWIEASQLCPGDLIFTPLPKRKIEDMEDIDLAKYASGPLIIDSEKITRTNPLTNNIVSSHNRYIPFDNDFAYILGRWIGDGWIRINKESRQYDLGIAFHSDDTESINKIRIYFENLGFNVKLLKAKNKKLVQMIIYNKTLATLFSSLFPEYNNTSRTKYIGKFKYLSNEMLRSLLMGLLGSDGHVSHDKKRYARRECIDTTSHRLACDIKECLLYLGIPSAISIRKEFKHGEYICRQSYKVKFLGLSIERFNDFRKIYENGYFSKIISIEDISDIKEVYDITVDKNHSYVTSNFAVHNSGAGSLVLYLLDVICMNPMDDDLKLIFERFLNPGRSSSFDFELEPCNIAWFRNEYPNKTWESHTSEEMTLREFVFAEIEKREDKNEVWSCAKREILPIENQELDGYYLACYDYAKEFGPVPNKPNSWIAYILGITDEKPVDALRILSTGSLPDVDSDFDPARRDDIIEYCKKKYGEDHVTNIGTYGEFATKSALQSVLKLKGYAHTDAAEISKAVPYDAARPVGIQKALENAAFQQVVKSYNVPEDVFEIVSKIEGSAFACVGEHPAGVVISPISLKRALPQHHTKNGMVTQYDLNDVEKAGFIKMDLLGLNNVNKISICLDMVREHYGKNLDLTRLPRIDKRAFNAVSKGLTSTIFQLAGQGMTQAVREVGIESFEDWIAIIALYRPGPMKYISRRMYDDSLRNSDGPPWEPGMTYAENKKDPSLIKYIHPDLEPILASTYGILCYQEQAMEISRVVGGFTMAQADVLRKAIGKKIGSLFEKCRDQFMTGAEKGGYSKPVATQIWKLMEDFADYAFNKAHSAVYALLGYWNAFLMVQYPYEWYAACLTADTGKEAVCDRYEKEAKYRLGPGSIIRPNVNKSGMATRVEYDAEGNPLGIVLPLTNIKGIGQNVTAVVENQPYENFRDFCVKVNPALGVFTNLYNGGALNIFGLGKADIQREYDAWRFEKSQDQKHKKKRVEVVPEIAKFFKKKWDRSIEAPTSEGVEV